MSASLRLRPRRRAGRPHPPPLSSKVVKEFALKVPTPWPHSTTTIPQLKLSTRHDLTTFDHDREPSAALDSFCALTKHTRDHPFFGSMEHADWMRWGYLHADHHLRQFNPAFAFLIPNLCP